MYSRQIPLERITSVSLEQAVPRVLRRTNGFSLGGTLRGRFRLAEIGDGQLFLELGTPPYVIVRTKTDYVIVNFDEPARTRDLYADLTEVLKGSKKGGILEPSEDKKIEHRRRQGL
jgi:hypothetical protein